MNQKSAAALPREVKERILNAVDAGFDELVRYTQAAVRINSVNPEHDEGKVEEAKDGETKVNRLFSEYMEKAGMKVDMFTAKNDRYNAVGIAEGGDGPSLLFNGHVDVVGAGDLSRWKVTTPFSGEIKDGKLYGRGSMDDKSGVACAIAAVKAIQDAGLKLKGKVLVESVCGEENMDTAAGTGACIDRGYTADAGICVEASAPPYPLAIDVASPGTVNFEVHIKGKSAHTSMRDEICRAGGKGNAFGASALDKAVFVYQGLRRLEEEWGFTKTHPAFTRPGHFTLNPGTFYAGPSPFAISEEAVLVYTAWYAPYEKEEDVKKEIVDYITKWCATDSWLVENPPEIKWSICWPPYDVPMDAPICKAIESVYEDAVERPVSYYGFAAVADAAFLNRAGIPTVILGAGDICDAHGPDEFVSLEEMKKAAKLYALTIAAWCGVE